MNTTTTVDPGAAGWPPLSYPEWKDTQATLHLWTQIVGKIRLAHTPWTNHSWHVALYVTSRGLTTSPMAYGARTFEIVFDFLARFVGKASPVHFFWGSFDLAVTRFSGRRANAPDAMLLDFLQSSVEAAADRGGWDRPLLKDLSMRLLPGA